jgi:ABC-type Fe3+/spermidine/putrescine transport system ATPase subunit
VNDDAGRTLRLKFERRFGSQAIALELSAGPGITVLFGPSGAGKSVTLRVIAGLLRPDSGCLQIGGTTLFDRERGIDVKPHRRPMAFVPQGYGLFPNMSVAENILYGALEHDAAATVERMLGQLGMRGFENRMPATLSGGQQQRVALARALARAAPVLLLDEPFSALDENLREDLRRELLRLRAELGLTIIFVTHDLREAHLLADRLAVLDDGNLLQLGPREEVFRYPVSARVAELTGVANVLPATVIAVAGDVLEVECGGLRLRTRRQAGATFEAGEMVDIAVRAERVNLRRRTPQELEGSNVMRGHVVEDFGYGSVHRLAIAPEGPGPRLAIELAARPYEVLDVAHHRDWTVELPAADIHVMSRKAL